MARVRAESKAHDETFRALVVENATGFGQEKFRMTFETIAHTMVPASHILAYHYTTVEGAAKALRYLKKRTRLSL